MSDLAWEYAQEGDLDAWAARIKTAYLTAVRDGFAAEGEDTRKELVTATTQALGPKVGGLWRAKQYPGRGKLAYNPGVEITSKVARLIAGHIKDQVILPKGHKFLAIPVPGSPADKVRHLKGTKLIQRVEAQFGKLRYVVTPRGVHMLVADNIRQTAKGAFRAAKEGAKRGFASYPMFWLVTRARMRKRLDFDVIKTRRERGFGAALEARIARSFAAVEAKE